jgi:3-keto-disaccharide hydrolase
MIELRGIKMNFIWVKTISAMALAAGFALAQPTLSIPETNKACDAEPSGAALNDTLVSIPDAEGFFSLFDGSTLKGWWESCKTPHSTSSGLDKVLGGVFMADPANKAIYTQQKSDGTGGLLMTNKQFENYELVLEFFGTYGDDAGIFNRTTATGKCYQTTLDYISGSSVGGAYGENGYTNLNSDPYTFDGSKSKISNFATWTNYTKGLSPTTFGCTAAGCGTADWTNVWDINGWNQIRVKFYGGLTAGSKVKLKSWFRKVANPASPGPDNWVPVYNDSQAILTPKNFIGLQIHRDNGRWVRGPGTWYRNIKWRPLDETGNPIGVVSTLKPDALDRGIQLKAASNALTGTMPLDHRIIVRDVNGRVLERFQGSAGSIHYQFSTRARGLMMVEVKTALGMSRYSVTRL